MLKVGLTGGIGSGKTTVAKVFINLGIHVYFADQEARILMETSKELIHSIKNIFGNETYKEGILDSKYLGNIVFNDPDKLRKLNQLTHPAVHRHFEDWLTKNQEAPYVVEEAALLCESGAYKFFDYIVLVTAPIEKRIQRVISRDGLSESDVKSRMKSQMPEEDKILLSNFLIFNDDEKMVLNQVLAFHKKMISLNNN